MTRSHRLVAGLWTSLACALLGAAPASAAAPVAPGDYEGAPLLESGGVYETAFFSVAKRDGRRRIVATGEYASQGIFYPDPGGCDDERVPLTADRVAINGDGRFKVRDRTVLDDLEIVVVWRGTWKRAKRATGRITVKSGRCSTTAKWSARRVAKPVPPG